jgi:hypothetical protein
MPSSAAVQAFFGLRAYYEDQRAKHLEPPLRLAERYISMSAQKKRVVEQPFAQAIATGVLASAASAASAAHATRLGTGLGVPGSSLGCTERVAKCHFL